MIRFLILPDAAAADTRSRAAWTPGDGDTITTHRWGWRLHPTDGRAAMMIPDGDEECLSSEEVIDLVEELSTDWVSLYVM